MSRTDTDSRLAAASSGLDRRAFLAWSACSAAHLALAGVPAFAATADKRESTPRLRRLELRTEDPAGLAEFYRGVLGLTVTSVGSDVSVQAGPSTLHFTPGTGRPIYHFAFNIPENKLSAAMAWMEDRAPLLIPSWQDSPVIHFRSLDAHSVYFNDPAGNILEFIAHHSLGNGRAGSFDPSDILYVSEIGLVVTDFAMALRQLAAVDLKPYLEASEGFAAVGDPHGFLIVVAENRVWLPTDDVRSAVFPTDVEFAAASDRRVVLPGHPYEIVGKAE